MNSLIDSQAQLKSASLSEHTAAEFFEELNSINRVPAGSEHSGDCESSFL